MRQIIIALALILFPIISLAGTIRPDVDDEKYIEYGKKHECVLKVRIKEKTNDKFLVGYGSCTMIGPKTMVTAAHIVGGIDEIYVLSPDGKEIKVKYSAFPSLFKLEKTAERWDIAVCRLEEEIKLGFYPELYRDKDEIEKVCSIAGFGATGNHDTGVTDRSLQKRAGSNVIDAIINEMLVCTAGSERITSLEYLIASGDSGGGLFINKKLAGINSNVATIYKDQKADSDKNDFGCHTRVSNHAEWIDQCIEVFDKIETGRW
jgi:hypothetical protein